MTVARTVADVLAEHVTFEVECIDRMFLNVYQPRLQHAGGIVGYVHRHLGLPIASTAPLARIQQPTKLIHHKLLVMTPTTVMSRIGHPYLKVTVSPAVNGIHSWVQPLARGVPDGNRPGAEVRQTSGQADLTPAGPQGAPADDHFERFDHDRNRSEPRSPSHRAESRAKGHNDDVIAA